jgi:hypothetical protein
MHLLQHFALVFALGLAIATALKFMTTFFKP